MKVIHAGERPDAEIVREVAVCVTTGGTVIFPTETVYGIGCDPDNDAAINAIYVAKGRESTKPLALHVANFAQALPFVGALTNCARVAMERLWPGPVAIIVQRRSDRCAHATGSLATISLRCPDDDLCRSLLAASGPLAATSANRSGHPPFIGDRNRIEDLPEATLAVLAGPTRLGRESTIVDCTGDYPKILRQGALPAAAIVDVLGTSRPQR